MSAWGLSGTKVALGDAKEALSDAKGALSSAKGALSTTNCKENGVKRRCWASVLFVDPVYILFYPW